MTALLLFAALAVAGSSASPEPPPLREIGRSGNPAGICGSLVVHANSAISAALHDDAIIERAIARLRGADLENKSGARANAIGELLGFGLTLHDEAERGEAELKRLRAAADKNAGEGRKADLRAFNDSLSRALAQQKTIGLDLTNFLTFLDYRDLRDTSLGTAEGSHRYGTNLDPFGNPLPKATPSPPPMTLYATAGSPNQMAVAAANDFERRTVEIRNTERRASEHSEQAVSGCAS